MQDLESGTLILYGLNIQKNTVSPDDGRYGVFDYKKIFGQLLPYVHYSELYLLSVNRDGEVKRRTVVKEDPPRRRRSPIQAFWETARGLVQKTEGGIWEEGWGVDDTRVSFGVFHILAKKR